MEDQELTKRQRQDLNRQKSKEEVSSNQKKGSLFNKILALVGIVGVAFIFWKLITSGEAVPENAPLNLQEAGQIQEGDYIYGNKDSKIVLVEYADFQCPACGVYHPITKKLQEEFGDRVAFVHRDFPLRTVHRHAQISSQAAYAANLQGKFWEMHDKLFESQEDWSTLRDPKSEYEKFAVELGIDVEKFKQDMNSDEAKNFVDNAYNKAVALNLNSTPTFILNGESLESPRGYEPFKALIEEKLNSLQLEASPSAEVEQ